MSFAENFMLQGTFTVPSTFSATAPFSININTGFLPTKIQLINQTEYGQLGTGNENIQDAWWDYNNPNNTNGTFINAAGTSLVPFQINATSTNPNGISQYDGTQSILLGPAIVGTTIVKATNVFTTSTAHGFQIGDTVQITNNVVMKQLGGLWFTIATVPSTTSFTVVANFINTANFTQETAYVVRKVIVGPLYYPNRVVITAITQASPMVVTTTPNHRLTVGQQVRIRVPAAFGMVQANNLRGTITAVTPSTFTLGAVANTNNTGINSTAFTAFAWPAATSIPFSFAYVEPIGAGPAPVPVTYLNSNTYNVDVLDDATTNEQFQGFTVGTGFFIVAAAGAIGVTAGDVFTWTAWRADI
jgi:hypothetical protein